MSSRTLVAVHRSMERDHDVLPPVRQPYAVSELRWSATCGATRSTIRKCQHSDIRQPPSLETPIVGADGGRSCSLSTGRDRTTYCTVDYGLCPHFGRARSGDLSSNATPVTRSSLRPTSSLGPVHGRTNGARPTYWALPAIDQRNTSSYFHPSTIGQLATLSPDVFAIHI